jgi:hypothetical protein
LSITFWQCFTKKQKASTKGSNIIKYIVEVRFNMHFKLYNPFAPKALLLGLRKVITQGLIL